MLRLSLLVVTGAVLGACASSGGRDETAVAPTTPAAPTTSAAPTIRPSGPWSGPVRLEVLVGDVTLVATLRDTAAARDLVHQLPLTVSMGDHAGVEKKGPLPGSLSLADDPSGADPDVADLGYYAPSNDLVLYYGNQSYFEGIVILGRLEGEVGALAGMDGDLEVDVRRLSP